MKGAYAGSTGGAGRAQRGHAGTRSLLLPLPTVDFSMPCNVIILTKTVMALAVGSTFTLVVRRIVGADEMEGWDLFALKVTWRGRLAILRERMLGATVKEKKEQ